MSELFNTTTWPTVWYEHEDGTVSAPFRLHCDPVYDFNEDLTYPNITHILNTLYQDSNKGFNDIINRGLTRGKFLKVTHASLGLYTKRLIVSDTKKPIQICDCTGVSLRRYSGIQLEFFLEIEVKSLIAKNHIKLKHLTFFKELDIGFDNIEKESGIISTQVFIEEYFLNHPLCKGVFLL